MLLVEPHPNSNTPGVHSASKFCLRIRSGATSPQVVDLPEGKTTIGSSPRCDIRIQRPGVQPLHCLILRESDGLSVRRWAAGTRLNGKPFDEARLAAGDQLTVGEVELEVEGSQFAAAGIEDKPCSNAESTAEGQTSTQEARPVHDSWGEWNSTRQTVLSAARQNDARQERNQPVEANAEPQTGWMEQWGQQHDAGQHSNNSNSRLTGLHEQLVQLQDKVALWKEAREAWQQEKAEWRAEREQTQRLWTEFQQQLVDVQSRADEIAGRIERLEHSIAAQALVPKFPASHVDLRPTAAQADQIREVFADPESTASVMSPLDVPTASVVEVGDEAKSETEDELSPFAEFSIWRQGAASSANPSVNETAGVELRAVPIAEFPVPTSDELPATSADKSWQVAPAKSFIEQYGHLFADDGADAGPSSDALRTVAASGTSDVDTVVRKPPLIGRAFEADVPKPVASEEEESIEQYMSKLLQRVRGDQPQIANPQAPAATSALGFPAATPPSTQTIGAVTKTTTTTGELPGGAAKGDWLTTSLGTVRRKAPMVEQAADLKTLRDLANETARRAISTHGLRIHRRNATTKVIVSMLAGMTSLWLMLDAGDWRDLQFISACVALVAAAYWAGQTFCELLETFRFATYDGPEDKLQGFARLPPTNSQADIKS
jgi:hypothetical protein